MVNIQERLRHRRLYISEHHNLTGQAQNAFLARELYKWRMQIDISNY